MHAYSIDSDVRKKAIIAIFITSILISVVLNSKISNIKPFIDSALNEHQGLKSMVDFIVFCGVIEFSPLIVFGFLYLAFDKFVWRCLSKVLGVPNINGEWCGTLTSSHKINRMPTEIDMKLTVHQTWDKISFRAIYPNSESVSSTASIQIEASLNPIIAFSFINDSKDVKLKTKKYDGYNILTLNGNNLSGRYFTNRENGTIGTFSLEKTKNKKSKL